jgi:hypothetical protein
MLETIEDWQTYIRQLAGPLLRSKAVAANSHAFVQMMRDEGHSMELIEEIITTFVRQLVLTNMLIPDDDGAFDLVDISETDLVCANLIPLSDDQIQAIIDHPPEEPPDAVDIMVAEIDEGELGEEWGPTLL